MSEPTRPAFGVGVYYKDPRAALAFLEAAFGFEPLMVVENEDGTLGHSEMRAGDGLVMVGREWDERHRSPLTLGGVNQDVHIQLEADIDAHFERAKTAGATVVREPTDQFYGDRSYIVTDPEGHFWSFSQTLKAMSHGEMAAASPGAVSIRTRL